MDKYYYLISQLPLLVFGQEPSVTSRHFLEEAFKWLNEDEYDSLLLANISEYCYSENITSKLLNDYCAFEYTFRSEIALWRKAVKEGHDYRSMMFPLSLVKEGNPLEVEIKLLRFRWQYIEEIQAGHFFDLDAVMAYFLKLQILEHLFMFDKAIGTEKFKKLIKISTEDKESEVN